MPLPPPPRRIAALAVLLAAALADACGGDPTPPTATPSTPLVPVVRGVRIEPRNLTLELSDTARLRAVALDSAGQPVAGTAVGWSVDVPIALAVDSAGLLRSGAHDGTFHVVARAGSVADTATVVVRPRISFYVWPDTSVLYPGMARALSARRWDADSNGTGSLAGASWTSSDPGVVAVDGAGRVTAVRTGHATISAARGDRRSSAAVYVLAHDAPLRFVELRPGTLYTCARTADGEAYCWGMTGAALGTAGPTDRCETVGYTTSRIPRLARTVSRCARIPLAVGGGVRFASLADGAPCGLTADGAAYCWGDAVTFGPEAAPTPLPRRVAGLPALRQLASGCGVSVEGELYCWDLGYPYSPPRRLPAPATGRWAEVSTGSAHRCALTTEGVAYCWGRSDLGQLGIGAQGAGCDNANHFCADPTPVASGERFVAIGAGMDITCALRADGTPFCWGYGGGQPWPAQGGIPRVLVPTQAVTPEPLVSLTVRVYSTCGLSATGATYCWGLDIPGHSGIGFGQDVFARTSPPFALRTVVAGGYHLCGIATDGIAWCWGGGYHEGWGAGLGEEARGTSPGPLPVAGQ